MTRYINIFARRKNRGPGGEKTRSDRAKRIARVIDPQLPLLRDQSNDYLPRLYIVTNGLKMSGEKRGRDENERYKDDGLRTTPLSVLVLPPA